MRCPSCDVDDLTGLYCSNCGTKLLEEEKEQIDKSKQEEEVKIETDDTKQDDGLNQDIGIKEVDNFSRAKKKPILPIFAAIGGIFLVILFIYMIDTNNKKAAETSFRDKESKYQNGIQLIKDQKWTDATVALVLLKDGKYKDAETLYNYASSYDNYGKNNYNMANYYMKFVPNSYNGDLSDQILAFKKALNENKPELALDMIKRLKLQDAINFCSGDDSLKPFYNLAEAMVSLNNGDFNAARRYAENIENYNGYATDEINSYKNTILNETTPERIKANKKSKGVSVGMTKQDALDSSWGEPIKKNITTNSYGVHEQWVYGGNNYLYFDDGILTTIQN